MNRPSLREILSYKETEKSNSSGSFGSSINWDD